MREGLVREVEGEEGGTHVADDFVGLVVDGDGLTEDGWTQHGCCAEMISGLLCLLAEQVLLARECTDP